MSSTTDNRIVFLAALRSGQYKKGPIETDSKGHPTDPNAEGYCAVGLAHTLFYSNERPNSLLPMRKALGLSANQFTQIQQEWNDSKLTFSEIADLIESKMFFGKR